MLQEEWGCKLAGAELCVANLLEFNWYPNTDTRVEWNNDTSMNVHADTDTDTDMGKSSIPILIPISEEYQYRFQKILINFYRYPMFYWYQYLHLINTNTDTGILDHCPPGSLILHIRLPGKRWCHFSVLRKCSANLCALSNRIDLIACQGVFSFNSNSTWGCSY